MTCCSATFECVDANGLSMVSSALQERTGVLTRFGQGSGVNDHDSALGHAGERASSFPGTTSRKSLSLPTRAMMKSWPWAACFASARFAAGLGNQSIFPPWRRCGRVDVSYFAQIPDGQRRRLTTIETPSQSVRSLIQAEPGTHPGVRGLAPKHVGRKDIPCKYLQSFKENR
jgi:hypothetical protein